MNKYSIEYCRNLAKSRHGKCLSTFYKNTQTKMKWQCNKGHEFLMMLDVIHRGSWCQECAGKKKHTLQYCQKLAIQKRGACLSNEYVNKETKMKWQCNKGHTWEAIFNSIKRGSWCPKCAGVTKYTLQDCIDFAHNMNSKCLSTEYKGALYNMLWECQCGFQWKACFSSVKNNKTWCPKCANKRLGQTYALTIEDCHLLAKNSNITCLSTVYHNSSTRMPWQCQNGHIWETTYNSIYRGTRCPKCNTNKTEKQVRKIFETKFNKEFPTVKPNFLKNPVTGCNLELDGYCEELKLAFEYDGEQHYRKAHYHTDDTNLHKQQQRDKLKDQLCKNANITLIRIPYWEKDNLEEFIQSKIDQINNPK